jgi:hypothetical protein
MKKSIFLCLAIATSIAFSSCGSKQTQDNYTDLASNAGGQTETAITIVDVNSGKATTTTFAEIEQWQFTNDSAVVANSKTVPTKFNKAKAEVFFVKNWNTPDLYAFNNQMSGCSWDGNIFYGYEENGFVYFVEEYKISSQKCIEKTKLSSVVVEKKIPATAVSTDPRMTCWWINTIQDEIKNTGTTRFNLDTFLVEATTVRDNVEWTPYLAELKKKILNTQGKTEEEKLVNYTAQAVEGKPETWNATDWPGDYQN